MEKFKRIAWLFLRPPLTVASLLVPLSLLLLLFSILWEEGEIGPLSYAAYLILAYALTVWCFRIPAIFKIIKGAVNRNRYVIRYKTDVAWRLKIELFSALMMNSIFAAFQLGLGIKHHSVWFYSLAIYYFLLALMRFFLFRDVRSYGKEDRSILSEWQRYRFCGVILSIMSLFLVVIVLYITFRVRIFVHHPITTIILAAYTFIMFSMAIVNIVRFKKHGSPAILSVKVISFSAALVSMMTLENAMLNTFGDKATTEGAAYVAITCLTGMVVCSIILVTALAMIIKSKKEINKIHEQQRRSKQ